MNYIFTYEDAVRYNQWHHDAQNRMIIQHENELIMSMIEPVRGESLLGIGCGTGMRLFPFLEKGLQVTGLDPSHHMINLAKKNVGNRVDFYNAFGEDLPFDDNAFNIAVLINTLEFVDDPFQTLVEACRVAKDRLFIGIWNKYALKNIHHQLSKMLTPEAYDQLHFMNIIEIKKMVKTIMGKVPIQWLTAGQFGGDLGWFGQKIEQSQFMQNIPLGVFIGIVIILNPTFRMRPLELKTTKTKEAFAGAV